MGELERNDGIPHKRPICPHCGELAPYGDERLAWISWHIDHPIHAWWWRWKNRKKK